MKPINHFKILSISLLILSSSLLFSQQKADQKDTKETSLKTYLIEREIPNAGALTSEELKGISIKSCEVLNEMGPSIQWIHSYVTGNKVFCIYKAENEELIRKHGEKGGFPVNSITEIGTTISPATAKSN